MVKCKSKSSDFCNLTFHDLCFFWVCNLNGAANQTIDSKISKRTGRNLVWKVKNVSCEYWEVTCSCLLDLVAFSVICGKSVSCNNNKELVEFSVVLVSLLQRAKVCVNFLLNCSSWGNARSAGNSCLVLGVKRSFVLSFHTTCLH